MLQQFINAGKAAINTVKLALTPRSVIAQQNDRLFATAVLRRDRVLEVDMVLNKLLPGIERYKSVAKVIHPDMPWWVVMLEHAMEAGAKRKPFDYHLHCGDPLTGRTYNVPAGRPKFNPKQGDKPPSFNNPYTWEESAIDALLLAKYDKETDWSIGNQLREFEEFNGLGYRKWHPKVPTPYVWSFTTVYTKGKYVSDGKFDDNAVSQQPGCAAYLLRLKEKGLITV